MNQSIEREFKTLITQAQFARISADQLSAKHIEQTNYYFELPNQMLAQQQLSLRIRTYATKAEQTLKIPNQSQQHDLTELTEPLSLITAHTLIKQQTIQKEGPIMAYFKQQALNWPKLYIWGYSTTRRLTVQLPIGCLALDQTTYPDQFVDYELELEVADFKSATTFYQQLLRDYQITPTPIINKIQRAQAHQAN